MIIDLNLKGQQVVLVGGGREASRKVEALLSQDCEIIVVTETICEAIKKTAEAGKINWISKNVEDGNFLSDYPHLRLVLAVTDDRMVNRKIVEAAKSCVVMLIPQMTLRTAISAIPRPSIFMILFRWRYQQEGRVR